MLSIKVFVNGEECEIDSLSFEGLHEAAYQARTLADECDDLRQIKDQAEEPDDEDEKPRYDRGNCPPPPYHD